MVKLLLWGVDHTLITTGGVGQEIFADCFERVTGQVMTERAPADGMTEPAVFRRTAELHGLTGDRPMVEAFARLSAEQHRARAVELRERGRALPGAADALAAVARLGDTVQSVVSGNIAAVADAKLTTFGLDTRLRLPLGGYGEDHEERSELVRVALQRTRSTLDTPLTAESAVLIGDAPSDVAAGLIHGVRVLAVATGNSTVAELRDAGADGVLPDLTDPGALLDALADR
ncbi:HAD family hydrolase [Streptomyces sp. NPDC055962]|uniref:HAD family hydrolase n=1 Tax=Streptomyces sp. NPDC055962 TaxID=3345667 RepID=UPI0035DD86AA